MSDVYVPDPKFNMIGNANRALDAYRKKFGDDERMPVSITFTTGIASEANLAYITSDHACLYLEGHEVAIMVRTDAIMSIAWRW